MARISDAEYRFLWRLAAHLWDDVMQPIRETRYSTHRLVYVLGCIRVRIEDERARIIVKGMGWPNRTWQGGAELMMEKSFQTHHFLQAWLSHQYGRSDRYGEASRWLLDDRACFDRMTRALFRFIRVKQEFTRFKVAYRRVFFPDNEVRKLTLKMKCQRDLSHHQYLFTHQNFEWLNPLYLEKPQLFPLLEVIRSEYLNEKALMDGGYAEIKRILMDAGMLPWTWRMLAKHGIHFWRPLVGSYEFEDLPKQTLVMYGNLLAYCQRPDLPPSELVSVWAALGSLMPTLKQRSRRISAVFHAAWRECDRLTDKKARHDFIRNEVAPALRDWTALVNLDASVTLGLIPPRMAWKTVVRRLQRYTAQQHAETLSDELWPAPDPAFSVHGYDIAPVKHQREAFQVGLALRNCFSYAPRHEDKLVGGYRHFVFRQAGKPVAMMCLHNDFTIRQLRGSCNTEASNPLLAAALAYIEKIKLSRCQPKAPADSEMRWSRRVRLSAAA
jgi:hypothetical protein